VELESQNFNKAKEEYSDDDQTISQRIQA